MATVVKRRGHEEEFDERKVYGSVYAACASAREDERTCETVADAVTERVKSAAEGTGALPSEDIREMVRDELAERDERLAFFYDKHLPDLDNL
ncbi:MAG: ATP cone domain-containing protein [Candidatus Nanohaloarchaea archaeon]|nr:ATP cone domain-containing protein [Candidatus Nanohaloarchaea archaeon]